MNKHHTILCALVLSAAAPMPSYAQGPTAPRPVAHGSADAMQTQGPPVPLQLRADKPAITFFYRDSASLTTVDDKLLASLTYKRICTAPCDSMLAPGTYMMALSKGHSDPAPVEEPVVVQGPTTMQGKHTSYKELRIAGTIVGIGSAVGGLVLIGFGFARTKNDGNDLDPNWTQIGVGVGVIIAGAIISSLMHKSDTATVSIVPFMTPDSVRPSTSLGAPALDLAWRRIPAPLAGLGLAYAF